MRRRPRTRSPRARSSGTSATPARGSRSASPTRRSTRWATSCSPSTAGPSPWPGPLSLAIRNRLHPEDEAAIRGSTDAEMLVPSGGRATAGRVPTPRASPTPSARRCAWPVTSRSITGARSRRNIIVGHAGGFAAGALRRAGRAGVAVSPGREGRWAGALLVASEPLDDGPGWRRVEPSTLVIADRDGLRTEPIGLEPAKHAPVTPSGIGLRACRDHCEGDRSGATRSPAPPLRITSPVCREASVTE